MVVGKLPDEVRPVPRRSVTFTVRQFSLGAKAMKRLAVPFRGFIVDHLRLTGGCGFPSSAAGWSRLTRNTVAPRLAGAEPFQVTTRPTLLQRRAFKLLGVKP